MFCDLKRSYIKCAKSFMFIFTHFSIVTCYIPFAAFEESQRLNQQYERQIELLTNDANQGSDGRV